MRRLTFALTLLATLAVAAPAGAASLAPCKEMDGWECGSIEVPVDRANAALGTTGVDFAVRRHSGDGPAAGTLLTSDGPGNATIPGAAFFFGYSLGPLLDTHDLVAVDVRGTGADPLDCPDYQHGVGPWSVSVTACATQIGAARDFYTYSDLADDMDAVRAALGLDKVSVYATGHATPTAEAYAVRHPAHTRAVVLDSAAAFPTWPVEDLGNAVDVVSRVCTRSPLCSSTIPRAEAEIAWLARQLRREPLRGTGYDSLGNPHRVKLTEGKLAYLLLFDKSGPMRTHAELPAAARALRAGDRVPLLRLAAENDYPFFVPFDQGDPAEWSTASQNAAYCAEFPQPWDKSASRDVRLAQYRAARAHLPRDYFAPFSLKAGLSPFPDEQCLAWPAPARVNSIAPAGGAYPDVPALVIHGDLNTDHPIVQGRRVAARFPHGVFVGIEQAGQSAAGWSGCARRIIATFVRTLRTGDVACADDERGAVPGLGAFPLRVKESAPAVVDPAGGDRSTRADRKVVAVAVNTYVDAVYTALFRESDDEGRGLRGGTYAIEFGEHGMTLQLHDVRWVKDLAVGGTGFFGFDAPNSGTLSVPGGTIDLGDEPLLDASSETLHVTGRLHGRPFRLIVPIR